MSIKKDISIRVYIVFILLLVFAIGIVTKLFVTQQIDGYKWKAMADSLTTDYKIIEADRGNIYSADNKLLSTSLPFFEIRMDTRAEEVTKAYFMANIEPLSIALANLFKDKTAEQYKNYIQQARKNKERYLLIKRKATYTELLEVRKMPIFNLGKYKGGLIAIQESRRVNPYKLLAYRTIGCVRENAPLIGLEAAYDTVLRGSNGRKLMQRIAGNTWIPISDENSIEPQNGKDIITTIDVGLQDVAEKALLNTLVKNEAEHGCVILMEVKTGKIRAIANLGRNENGLYYENENFAIRDAIEPGSTFKLTTCAALLEAGLADTSSKIDLEHGDKIYGKQHMKDHELAENYVSLKRAFEISSNVGLSKFAYNAFSGRPDKYVELLYQFELNKKTNIDLIGEANPDIKDTKSKRWNKVVSIPWMSVGYETRITPLQTLCFYNAIANDGKRVKPYIVSEIKEYGKPVYTNTPSEGKQIVSINTAKKLQGIMLGVVENGTAKKILKNENYLIAGKTGTAQIFQLGSGGFNNKGGGGGKKFLASFVGYFPADKPMYSCIVAVYNPTKDKSVYYGSQVACPVFKELADKIYATATDIHVNDASVDSSYNPNDKPEDVSGASVDVAAVWQGLHFKKIENNNNSWINVFRQDNDYQVSERNFVKAQTPNVVGLSAKDAIYILENAGLKVEINGMGKVKNQSIEAGEIYSKGSKIILALR